MTIVTALQSLMETLGITSSMVFTGASGPALDLKALLAEVDAELHSRAVAYPEMLKHYPYLQEHLRRRTLRLMGIRVLLLCLAEDALDADVEAVADPQEIN